MDYNFSGLRFALPYIREFRDKIFVVKVGGELFDDADAIDKFVEQLAILHFVGIHLVVVHGGGKHATKLAEQLGVKTEMVDGRRVTSKEMLEVAKMSFAGALNTDLLALCAKHQIPAVGLSGIDAGIVVAKKRERLASRPEVDFGFVAECESVNVGALENLISGNYMPVLCPLTADKNGQVLNINADTLASQIAIALKAKSLIFVGAIDGVMRDINNRSSLLSLLNEKEVQSLINDKTVSGGMIPKLTTSLDALKGGVGRVHIISGVSQDALLREIFTNEGAGTMIVQESDATESSKLESGFTNSPKGK